LIRDYPVCFVTGRLKFKGISVEEATKVFRLAAYGQAF